MAKNAFKPNEKKGQGLSGNVDKIREEIRRSSTVRGRLTGEEKRIFNAKIKELTLSESNVIRQLVAGFVDGTFKLNN